MFPPREMTLENRIAMTARGRDADAIPKIAGAGEVFVDADGQRLQRMHNGLVVVADGYCGPWMTRLIALCQGHHEPQEELTFHALLARLSDEATMIEIGAAWCYYSMWFLKDRPRRRALAVEPDPSAVALGRRNLALNGLSAPVVCGYIGERYLGLVKVSADPPAKISVEDLMRRYGFDRVDLLHCDAQGAEVELIEAGENLFRDGRVGWLMVSTHGATITGDPLTHQKCLTRLEELGARIEVEHDVHESFSGDGLILARFNAPEAGPFPKISRNRYSESFYRNPLYDLAEAAAPDGAAAR